MPMTSLQISEPVCAWARLDTRALLESDNEEILSIPPGRGGALLLGYLEAMLADGQKECKHSGISFRISTINTDTSPNSRQDYAKRRYLYWT